MGCCDKNNNAVNKRETDSPDGIDPCCSVGGGSRCVCLPYDDPWAISALILSIVATLVSWVWWVTFVVSIIALALIQILWCVRVNSIPLYSQAAVAGASSLTSLGLGIYILIRWKRAHYCYTFDMVTNDDDEWMYGGINKWGYDTIGRRDGCPEKVWGSIALVCAILWAAAAVCMIYFVKSGRHAKWEDKHNNTSSSTPASTGAVELASASPAAAQVPSSEDPVIADAAVLASDSSKIDNV